MGTNQQGVRSIPPFIRGHIRCPPNIASIGLQRVCSAAMPLPAWKSGLLAAVLVTLTAVPMGCRFVLAAYLYKVILSPMQFQYGMFSHRKDCCAKRLLGGESLESTAQHGKYSFLESQARSPSVFLKCYALIRNFPRGFETIPKLNV
jgi:hypothetical protein